MAVFCIGCEIRKVSTFTDAQTYYLASDVYQAFSYVNKEGAMHQVYRSISRSHCLLFHLLWKEVILFLQQECIPVGCVPPARSRTRGSSWGSFIVRQQRSPRQRLPWTETPPLDRDPSPGQRPPPHPQTETPLDREPHPGQRPPTL